MYKITLSEQARKEYLYFSQSGNKAILNKIAALLNDIAEHPYTGLGKPEPLKYELAGKWSRRISVEHRLVYSVNDDIIEVHIFSRHYKIFCVNGKYGIQVEFRIFYFIALQNEEDYERKESSSA